MNRADDRIYWAPLGSRGTIINPHFPWLVHLCPSAVVVHPATRHQLDPMALGVCRYCREPLPEATA